MMKFAKILQKTTKYLLLAALLVILASNLLTILAPDRAGSRPGLFGFSSAVVISGSMEPAIGVDDMIVIKDKKSYQVGDVITFSTGGNLPVTHRIVGTDEQGRFLTKGDANNGVDREPVAQADVLGKVIVVIPRVGVLIDWLKTPLGMLGMVLVGVLAIEMPQFSPKSREKNAEKGCGAHERKTVYDKTSEQ